MFLFKEFSHSEKLKIAEAIAEAERGSSGEIRVHLSYSKSETDLLQLASAKFHELKMDETKLRNGALLYVNPRIKKFSIFGDEGIHARVHQSFWEELAKNVTEAIHEKDAIYGIVLAVQAIGAALKVHFPQDSDDKNELHNDVTHSN